jgi:hypothetical protein
VSYTHGAEGNSDQGLMLLMAAVYRAVTCSSIIGHERPKPWPQVWNTVVRMAGAEASYKYMTLPNEMAGGLGRSTIHCSEAAESSAVPACQGVTVYATG